LILHLDEQTIADRLVHSVSPQSSSLLAGLSKEGRRERDPQVGEPGDDEHSPLPRRLGVVLGQMLTLWLRRGSVMIVWGDATLVSSLRSDAAPSRSIAMVCGGWAAEGRTTPQRLGAFWPGRFGYPQTSLEPAPAARHALTDDPPAVWWGWNDAGQAHDLVR